MSSHSVRRIRRLQKLLGATRYLEIGVNRGATFNNLDFTIKTGVDPSFQFDVNDFGKPGVSFHPVTSDNFYFHLSSRDLYDIVFLDGLHTYEQTYRDFCHSLMHAHDNTFFIIDDTLPIDRFSSMRTPSAAFRMRQQEGNEQSVSWHGDVYKVLILLKLFHPNFEYATIVGDGNPQTIAWKECSAHLRPNASNVKPFTSFSDLRYLFQVFQNFGSIDYSWLIDGNRDILQECQEEHLFGYFESAFHWA